MKRILLVAAAVVVLAAVILAVRFFGPGPRIRPTLSLALPTEPDGGQRVRIESSVQLQVGISAPAYVYLFDEVAGRATLVAPHAGGAWEAGVYETESEVLLAAGLHTLVLIASPTPKKDWLGVTAAEKLVSCKGCESATVRLEVYGEIPKRDFPKINPNQEFNLPPEEAK